jgi:hypothetical protein
MKTGQFDINLKFHSLKKTKRNSFEKFIYLNHANTGCINMIKCPWYLI